ncbi:MAG: nucleoside triphosphate pyrophosphohydrolase [Bacteroidetes bacterium]|nr:nucleoside triphosphate pyrophosphohydrolase [Bacteroidota bacterium]
MSAEIPVKHLTQLDTALPAFARLLRIMDELREHCPWDKEQTFASIRHLSIEELYELSDAILQEDWEGVRGELGDLLLHIVFYARMADEAGRFDIAQVLHTLCDKLVRRHPHIYGTAVAADSGAVKRNWEQIKQQENGGKPRSVLAGVPASMPALLQAYRMQEKVAAVGFDWEAAPQVWDKVQEELGELQTAVHTGDAGQMTEELGDVLFSLINYARFIGVNPEDALARTNRKFMQRFRYIEDAAQAQDKALKEMSLEEMEALWQEAKKKG